jgi:hypothetical protein
MSFMVNRAKNAQQMAISRPGKGKNRPTKGHQNPQNQCGRTSHSEGFLAKNRDRKYRVLWLRKNGSKAQDKC